MDTTSNYDGEGTSAMKVGEMGAKVQTKRYRREKVDIDSQRGDDEGGREAVLVEGKEVSTEGKRDLMQGCQMERREIRRVTRRERAGIPINSKNWN